MECCLWIKTNAIVTSVQVKAAYGKWQALLSHNHNRTHSINQYLGYCDIITLNQNLAIKTDTIVTPTQQDTSHQNLSQTRTKRQNQFDISNSLIQPKKKKKKRKNINTMQHRPGIKVKTYVTSL